MGKLRWYKRDPVAALEGMSNLSLEERGAYDTILDLIYARDGAVDDDPRFLAGWMRCDVRVWKRIRARLIDLEKLYEIDGTLRNSRADEVVADALLRGASLSEANSIKGRKSGAARSKNKDIAEPQGEPQTNISTTRVKTTEVSKKEDAPKQVPLFEIASRETTDEAELFVRGKKVLGNGAGGLIASLLKSKKGNVALARAAIEQASTKENPREYVGRILSPAAANERHGVNDPHAGII